MDRMTFWVCMKNTRYVDKVVDAWFEKNKHNILFELMKTLKYSIINNPL